MIEFQNVSYCYDEANEGGIMDINFSAKKGEFVLLCGRSGCGKTTVTRCINGLIPHFFEGTMSGHVFIDGQDTAQMELRDISKKVGSVFQDPRSQFFTTDTVSEVAFACENMAIPHHELIERVDAAIEKLNINHLRGKSLFELSSGERQRIAIASVYALAPEVYVFDEPSANLDAKATHELAKTLSVLKASGATVIISEHRLYYLKDLIDKVIYLEDGKIQREFTATEFLALSYPELNKLGLRCIDPNTLCLPEKVCSHGRAIVQIAGLSFRYRKNVKSLTDISFQAAKGCITGIVGHNGAGKSTLAEVICGLLKEESGAVFITDKRIPFKQRIPLSYFIMQDTEYQLFSESVLDELTLGLGDAAEFKDEAESVLETLHLTEYKDRHPASLSGGQKQRVVIAAAYMRDLKIVFFDEPTSGLDAENMKRVGNLMQDMAQKGIAVFVITHDYELILNACQKILRLDHGELVEDYSLDKGTLPKLKQFFQILNKEGESHC